MADPVSAHPSEPLWRGPSHDEPGPAGLSYIHAGFKAPVGTEVEVRPAGSHPTLPTYEEVRAVVTAAWRSDCPTPEWMDLAAHNLMALFSGVEVTEEKQTQ